MQTIDEVLPNGMRPRDMAEAAQRLSGDELSTRKEKTRRAMRARRQRMSPQKTWDMERQFFNHAETKFRLNGRLAKAMGYNSLADATRAVQRAARAIRNSTRPPCGHIRAKIGLLELVK